MPNKLKPCPFCGESQHEILKSPANRNNKYIRCANEECKYGAYRKLDDAVDGWNTRPAEDALRSQLETALADNRLLVEQYNEIQRRYDGQDNNSH